MIDSRGTLSLLGLLAGLLLMPASQLDAGERGVTPLEVHLDGIAQCAATDSIAFSGNVDSTGEVMRIFYTVGDGPEIDLCPADCGIDPSFSASAALAPCDNELTVTAVDAGGGEASASTAVILDTQPPALSGGGAAAKADGVQAVVDFVVMAQDNCQGSFAATCNPTSGSTFLLGETEVTCTGTDTCGNTRQVTFPITVYCESWHWPFDEGGGLVAADLSGHGDDGMVMGTLPWDIGQQDDAIACADGGIVLVPDTDPFDLQTLTVAAWVRPDTLGNNQILISKDNAYELEIGKVGADIYNLRLDNTVVGQGNTRVKSGVWQHLAATWNGSMVRYYYNGLPDGSTPRSGLLPTNATDVALCARSYSDVTGFSELPFEGRLDEVRIRACALTDSEIENLVQSSLSDITPPARSNGEPSGPLAEGSEEALLSLDTNEAATCRYGTAADTPFPDLPGTFDTTGGTEHSVLLSGLMGGFYRYFVRCEDTLGNHNADDYDIAFGAEEVFIGATGFWRFDEGAGCTADDAWGNTDGTLEPNCGIDAPQWIAGWLGNALSFTGGGQRVEVPHEGDAPFAGSVTVAAWIRHAGATTYHAIVDKRSGLTNGFALYVDPSSQPFLRINLATLSGSSVVADGGWHHVVGVYDGSELRIYVDGVLDAMTASSQALSVTASLLIGEHFSGTSAPFSGDIDEVLVYDRALSGTEVGDLYLALQPPGMLRGDRPTLRR